MNSGFIQLKSILLTVLSLTIFLGQFSYANGTCNVVNACPDSRYVSHTVSDLTTTSVKFTVTLSQALPMRMAYYPTSNPSQIQYGNCEYSTTYQTHIQTISGLLQGTDYEFIVQTSASTGNSSADCPIMIWEDISCPIAVTTAGNGNGGGGNSDCAQPVCATSTIASDVQITTSGNLFHAYSKRQAFSSDESMYVLTSSNTVIYSTATNQPIRNIPLSSELMWSDLDPNLLWGTQFVGNSSSIFTSYDISTSTSTTYFDATAYYGVAGSTVTIGRWEGTVVLDRYVLLQVSNPNGLNELLSLDLSTNPPVVLGTMTTPSWFDYGDFSPDGSCIMLGGGFGNEYQFLNPDLTAKWPVTVLPGYPKQMAHGDWIALPDGTNVFVMATDGNNSYLDPIDNTFNFLGTTWQNNGVSNSGHISGTASINIPGLYLASDPFDGGGNNKQTSFIVRLTGHPVSIDWSVNLGTTMANGTVSYNEQAKGTISPCGKYILYASDESGTAQTHLITMDNSSCPITPINDPELSPVIRIIPANISGLSTVGVVVEVSELNNTPTDGSPVVVRIPMDARLAFTWDPTLTTVGFDLVQNNQWTYTTVNSLFHQFEHNGVIPASGKLGFGFISTYDPQATSGQTTITSTVLPFSGGETNVTNNSDSELLVYFN